MTDEQRQGTLGYNIGEPPGKTAKVRYVQSGTERSLGIVVTGPGWYYQMSTDPTALLRGPYDTKDDTEAAVHMWIAR